jgi:antitoxin component YwqK of YwqJK toxin-antitoxin module
MRQLLLLCVCFLAFCQCKPADQSTDQVSDSNVDKVNLTDYDLTPIPGTNMQMATKLDNDSRVLEQGMIEDGVKTGTWATFFPNNGKIMEIKNYAAGKLNGLHILLNNAGRVDMYESYVDNQLYGKRMTFKLGTPVEEMSYKNGKLDGMFRGFSPMGKLQRLGYYVNGVQDGPYKVWNDSGQVIVDVMYKNGQQVK